VERGKFVYFTIVFMALLAVAVAQMPDGYNNAMTKMDSLNMLCVKNYQAGIVFTEVYKDFEHLDKDTVVVSRNNLRKDSPFAANQSALDATVNSNVIGSSHLAWESIEPNPNGRGGHRILGSYTEDLTGVFSINKLIQLWSNSTLGNADTEWLPCT
jgi:hypothetical protein